MPASNRFVERGAPRPVGLVRGRRSAPVAHHPHVQLLQVLRLEIVVPEDVQVVLDELGALLLDVDAAGAEELVVTGVVLLDDAQAGLGLDPRLLRVVDAARDVAMGVHLARGAQQGAQGEHGISSR